MRCKLCRKTLTAEDLIVDKDFCLDCIDSTDGVCLRLPKMQGLLKAKTDEYGRHTLSIERLKNKTFVVYRPFGGPNIHLKLSTALKDFNITLRGMRS